MFSRFTQFEWIINLIMKRNEIIAELSIYLFINFTLLMMLFCIFNALKVPSDHIWRPDIVVSKTPTHIYYSNVWPFVRSFYLCFFFIIFGFLSVASHTRTRMKTQTKTLEHVLPHIWSTCFIPFGLLSHPHCALHSCTTSKYNISLILDRKTHIDIEKCYGWRMVQW